MRLKEPQLNILKDSISDLINGIFFIQELFSNMKPSGLEDTLENMVNGFAVKMIFLNKAIRDDITNIISSSSAHISPLVDPALTIDDNLALALEKAATEFLLPKSDTTLRHEEIKQGKPNGLTNNNIDFRSFGPGNFERGVLLPQDENIAPLSSTHSLNNKNSNNNSRSKYPLYESPLKTTSRIFESSGPQIKNK